MRKMFRVTYDVVTPESAKHGEPAFYGDVAPCGSHFIKPFPMTLRQALRCCNPQQDGGRWFSEVDGRQNYRTGEVETRYLHPPRNITASSYSRLARLLKLEA